MATNYYIKVLRMDNWDTMYILTDMVQFSYFKQVNEQGMLTLTLTGEHPLLAKMGISYNYLFEIWRKPDVATSWSRDFVGISRQRKFYYVNNEKARVDIICPGLLELLKWRYVLYRANTNLFSAFANQKAETVLKRLVSYNATSLATTGNGRIIDGPISRINVNTDLSRGDTIDVSCAWANLLEAQRKIALVAGGDYDLTKNDATGYYDFEFYPGQLGTVKSGLTFARRLGNMSNPTYTMDLLNERTSVVAGGQGDESERDVQAVASVFKGLDGDPELFINSSNIKQGDTQGLIAAASQKLTESVRVEKFGFEALQITTSTYGVDYKVGDKCKAENPFLGTTHDVKITGVDIDLGEDRKEIIRPILEVY